MRYPDHNQQRFLLAESSGGSPAFVQVPALETFQSCKLEVLISARKKDSARGERKRLAVQTKRTEGMIIPTRYYEESTTIPHWKAHIHPGTRYRISR